VVLPHLNVLNPDRLVPEYQGELGMYKAVLTLKTIFFKKRVFAREPGRKLGMYKAVLMEP